METNVTSLFGGPVASDLEGDPRLIQDLERILEEARAGKVVAVAAALQLHDGEATFMARGRSKPLAMAGALEAVKTVVLQQAFMARQE